jgi:hypothetical protein
LLSTKTWYGHENNRQRANVTFILCFIFICHYQNCTLVGANVVCVVWTLNMELWNNGRKFSCTVQRVVCRYVVINLQKLICVSVFFLLHTYDTENTLIILRDSIFFNSIKIGKKFIYSQQIKIKFILYSWLYTLSRKIF